ncbi:MAG: hypothetical protein ABIO91_02105 [Pyrinomonadaceae bacterium]
MFYHPHFCCHCGEKVVRARWTLLTSRRFCDFCSIEQKQHDLIPRAAAVVLLLFGAAGFTAYLSGGNGGKSAPGAGASRAVTIRGANTPANHDRETPNAGLLNVPANRDVNATPPPANLPPAGTERRAAQRNSSTEPAYYCGAMTKKGTACTRRVKAPGRCWQHQGQPAVSGVQH